MATAKQVKLRRGTTLDNDLFTGAEGEVTVDTTKNSLRVHDGSTLGGTEIALADLSNIAPSADFDQRIKQAIQSLIDAGAIGIGGGGEGEPVTIGSVKMSYASPGVDYILANGAPVSKTTYPELYDAIGDRYTLNGITAGTYTGNAYSLSTLLYTYNFIEFAGKMYWPTSTGGAGNLWSTADSGVTWVQSSDGTTLGTTRSIVYKGRLILAGAGKLVSSSDGSTWTAATTSGFPANWTFNRFVVNGAGNLVAIGYNLSTGLLNIATSTDGMAWTYVTASASTLAYTTVHTIIYSTRVSLYMIGTDSGQIFTSPDLVTWTLKGLGTLTPSKPMMRIVEGTSTFVGMGGNGGSNYSLYTSPDGVTWTSQSPTGLSVYNNTLIWSPSLSLYVMAPGTNATTPGMIYTSPTGATWTAVSPGITATGITGVSLMADGSLVATGITAAGTWASTAPAGSTTFTLQAPAGSWRGGSRAIKDSQGYYWSYSSGLSDIFGNVLSRSMTTNLADGALTQVSTGSSGSNRSYITPNADASRAAFVNSQNIFFSTDAAMTSADYKMCITDPRGMVFLNNQYISFGAGGALAYSADGTAWKTVFGLPAGQTIWNLAWNGSYYLLVNAAGDIFKSTNLTTWTKVATVLAAYDGIWNLFWDEDRWLVGNASNVNIAMSTDGATWTVIAGRGPMADYAISSFQTVVMSGSQFQVTTDYVNWTAVQPPVGSGTLNLIKYANGYFVAGAGVAGTSSFVIVSADGISWRQFQLGTETTIVARILFDGKFFYAYTGTTIYTSFDALRWSKSGTMSGSPGAILASGDILYLQNSGATNAAAFVRPNPNRFRIPFVAPTSPTDGDYYIRVR